MSRTKTLVVAAIATLALSALAANATDFTGKTSSIQVAACEKEAWPHYSPECLNKINGEDYTGSVRLVSTN